MFLIAGLSLWVAICTGCGPSTPPPPPPPPLPGGLPDVIDQGTFYIINKGHKQLVADKGADFTSDWTVLDAAPDKVYALSGWLRVVDAATFRKLDYQFRELDPYKPSSPGYVELKKHIVTLPVAVGGERAHVEQFYAFMTNGPYKEPQSFRFTGKRGSVTKFTENGLRITMPGGPEMEPYIVLNIQQIIYK
ncbi:hypothetical protein DB346_18905 [Verrucomicrobia bacterium LW23]|nr:hypothetical protein DB346_18905 [Verrucomicrobia bacterium LW23]